MPTTFDVIYLGVFADIDPTEGTELPEDGQLLEGQTAGSPGAPLWQNVQTLALASDADGDGLYDTDNTDSNDTFTIDGGAAQIFDSVATYNATITYTNGTTDTLTAIVVQDTAGRVYLAPEKTVNSDLTVLEARPIQSITLDTFHSYFWVGTSTSFETISFGIPICLGDGAWVATAKGPRLVETLCVGDLVQTADHGVRPLRWVGRRQHVFDQSNPRRNKDRPIFLPSGALGAEHPAEGLVVSPQHRILVQAGPTGGEALVPAKALVGQCGIRVMHGKRRVTYYGLLFDRHEVIFANGARVESFRPGRVALGSLSAADRRAIARIYPGLLQLGDAALGAPARPLLTVRQYHAARSRMAQAGSKRDQGGGINPALPGARVMS